MEEVKPQEEADLLHACVCAHMCVYVHLLKSFFACKAHNSVSLRARFKHMPYAGAGNRACGWKKQDEVKQEHKDKLA